MGIYYNFLQFYVLERDNAGLLALVLMLGLYHINKYPFKEDVVTLFSFLRTLMLVFRICWTETCCFLMCRRVISTVFIQIFFWLLLFSWVCMKDIVGKRELVKYWQQRDAV